MRERIQQKKDKATCDKTDVLSFSVKGLFYFPKRVYDKNKLKGEYFCDCKLCFRA